MRHPLLALLLALLLPLATAAAELAPKLEGVEWIDPAQVGVANLPRVLFIFTPATPQAQEVAVELGRLQRQYRDQLQVIALSADPVPDLQAFRRKLGVEMGYPIGHAPAGLIAELSRGARGLPHSLLLAADGSVRWRGHPRALAQILPQHLTD